MRLVFPLVLKKGLGTNIMELNFASKDLSHYQEKWYNVQNVTVQNNIHLRVTCDNVIVVKLCDYKVY